jgi:serine/threonine-protein kinase
MPKLSPERWLELSPYLDTALEMDEEEQREWLSRLQEEDPSLANELEILLWKHRLLAKEGFLETDPVGAEARWGLAGQTVGVYTLKSQIGQGGMGSVWLAERSDGRFERQVAVKFLNLALMGRSGEERFRREGRILALLDHPHIAKLVDAGVLPTGQPYLVLEHIEGDKIDRYCDHHRYEIKARCELFLDVLDAVARAHASLIVHRDIKPSNVLVRNDGQVKLLDFGIAKLLEAGGGEEATQLTAEGVRAMTPESAAPEQLLGRPITTATDVYALGVLLFLLLTGEHPLGRDVHAAADLVKATLDTVPKRSSEVALSAGAGAAAQNAADRNTTVAKALKKEPAERYSSVTAMADDLRRHLANEPISAQPDTFAYRAGKFVRRNFTAVSLLALVVVTTAAGAVGTWMQARTARKQRDFAFHQLVRAQTTLAFNEFLLSDAAPSGKPFTVNELLGRAEEVLAHEQGGDADSRVELMVTIGDQYSTQDEPAKARRILEEAYKLSRTLDDRSVRAQASCSLAGQLARDGDLSRAEALIEEGLAELPREPQYDQDTIFCLRRGSEVSQERGDAQQGIARIKETWEVLKHSPFDSPSMELHPLIELAEAYRVAGQNRLAESTFQLAAALLSTLGQDRTQAAVALFNDWAAALDKLGRPREAEKLYRRAIDISRTGPTEETVSPMLLRNYAHTVRQLGRLEEAADYANRAYAKAKQTDDQDTLTVDLYTRALIDLDRRDYKQASSTLAELQPRLQRTFPPESYWFGVQASVEALLASARGDFGTAQTLADKAVAIAEAAKKAGRAGSDFLPTALLRRSEIELAASKPGRAEQDAQQALLILENDNGPGSPSSHVGHANFLRGSALQAQGKHAEAASAFRTAANHLSTTLGADHRDTQGALKMADLEEKVR